ncbi:glycolipid transfer protein, partial [Meredithblackwellia eburnea MCA 4105]
QRIRVRAAAHPFESHTLQALVQGESRERRKLATEALLWIFRGLKFTAMALRRNLDMEDEELSDSFTFAWQAEYSKYFNFLIRPLFKLMVKASPSRATFYDKLGEPRSKVILDLERWLSALELQTKILEVFYAKEKQ